MASGPITSWQIDGETVETVADFIFLGFKITTDGDCSHEIKKHFSQKTLPLLENQIKETHQRITEELQKYGKDIPEEESEKMFSLIEVRTASGAKPGSRASLSTGVMGVTLICLHFPKADPNAFCPLSTKTGPELEGGQGVVDHPMHAIGSSSSAFPHWGPPPGCEGSLGLSAA